MIYAREVIDLLAAFPGREWSMEQIVRHVSRGMSTGKQQRERYRKGVRRVLDALVEAHIVEYKPARRGCRRLYRWKAFPERDRMWDNGAAEVASAALASQPDAQ